VTAGRRGDRVRRRAFITLLGGAALAWPRRVLAQQENMPVVGFLNSLPPNNLAQLTLENFLQGLKEAGFVDGKNVTIEYVGLRVITIVCPQWRWSWSTVALQ